MNLSLYAAEIEQFLQTIHHIFDVESAVFDISANLISGSRDYLKSKGTSVHKPSIMEVIEKDEVTVLQPGKMKSCIGCRFNGNCPATLELLKCISIQGRPVGVLSFSAFSEANHNRIAEKLDYFEQIIFDFSNLLAMLLKNADNATPINFEKKMNDLLSLIPNGVLIIDRNGSVIASNDRALSILSGNCLSSIYDILPAELATDILNGHVIQTQDIFLHSGVTISLSANPSPGVKNRAEGAVLQFTAKNPRLIPPVRLPYGNHMHGSSSQMADVRRRMQKIADSPSSVFISGETGTGKSLLARTIHEESWRRDRPFIIISCANIPEALFESELFGYVSGAFTGALKTGKQGKMELAEDGTLFLDEISEMPLSMQAKLLTVLQDRQFERVGGTHPIPLASRIISASNADIPKRIAEGRFRADLFYRLNVINIEMCPLRERMDDLPELLNAFIQKFNQRLNTHVEKFDRDVTALFCRYSWPGNIRQLENIVEYCVNMAENSIITTDDLPPAFLREVNTQPLPALEKAEAAVIRKILNQYGWDSLGKARAAAALGISTRTLYRKIKKLYQDTNI